MELRDMVVGRLYRVNAGVFSGLYKYKGRADGSLDAALMGREGEPDTRVLTHYVMREAMPEEYATDRMRADSLPSEEVKGELNSCTDMTVDQGAAATVLCERIKAATTMVMHLSQLEGDKLHLNAANADLLKAAQGFLLRQFGEDEPMQEEQR